MNNKYKEISKLILFLLCYGAYLPLMLIYVIPYIIDIKKPMSPYIIVPLLFAPLIIIFERYMTAKKKFQEVKNEIRDIEDKN